LLKVLLHSHIPSLAHVVGSERVPLSVCGDMEVHQVADKFYAIDAGTFYTLFYSLSQCL